MEKLGYIVSTSKIKGLDDFVGLVNDVSLADPTKPILIVGLENAKKYSDNFSILNKKLSENVFWTFKKTEKREFYERDVEEFSKYIIQNVLNTIKYYYINIITLRYSKIKRLYNILFSEGEKCIYISNNMAYVLHEGTILGVSLTMLEYCGIKKDKVINKLKEKNLVCEDDCPFSSKLCTRLNNNRYIIPYFMSVSGDF